MLDMQTMIEFQRKDRNVKKDLPSLALLWAFKISWLTDSWQAETHEQVGSEISFAVLILFALGITVFYHVTPI